MEWRSSDADAYWKLVGRRLSITIFRKYKNRSHRAKVLAKAIFKRKPSNTEAQ